MATGPIVKVKKAPEKVEKLLDKLNKIANAPDLVSVGFPESKKYPDGTDLLVVAASNEFGTTDGRIPERSFLRAGILEKKNVIKDFWKKGKAAKLLMGELPPEKALSLLGLQGQTIVQNKIRAIQDPPNAESTIARKESSNPLIDTGLMIQSVTYVVEK